MPVIAVVFDTKQSFIGWLCIGQYITGCGAVHKTLFQKETDKPTLRDKQLFGGGAEVGTVIEVDEQIIKGCLTIRQSRARLSVTKRAKNGSVPVNVR